MNVMKESILQRYEICVETLINHRQPIPKITNAQSAKTAIEKANKAIDQLKEESGKLSLADVNHLMYATASAVAESLGLKTKEKRRLRKPNQTNWKRKVERGIPKIRGDISTLNDIKNEKSVKEKREKALFSKHNIKQEKQIPTII